MTRLQATVARVKIALWAEDAEVDENEPDAEQRIADAEVANVRGLAQVAQAELEVLQDLNRIGSETREETQERICAETRAETRRVAEASRHERQQTIALSARTTDSIRQAARMRARRSGPREDYRRAAAIREFVEETSRMQPNSGWTSTTVEFRQAEAGRQNMVDTIRRGLEVNSSSEGSEPMVSSTGSVGSADRVIGPQVWTIEETGPSEVNLQDHFGNCRIDKDYCHRMVSLFRFPRPLCLGNDQTRFHMKRDCRKLCDESPN